MRKISWFAVAATYSQFSNIADRYNSQFVPTESGGLPTESGARKGSVHKDCIRTRGGLLARTGRAIGLEWQEGSLPSNHVQRVVLRNSERRTMQAVQRHTAAQSAQQGRGRSATSADPY